jgi:hypothetical protein
MNHMDWEEEKKQKGDIPQKYKDLLQDVLNQMETETGNLYQFTVNKFGNPSNYNYVVGDFKNRKFKIEVYDMDPEYKELEGVYDSRNAVLETIEVLKNLDSQDKNIKNSLDEKTEELLNSLNSRKHIMEKCYRMHLSKWNDLHVSEHDGSIYTAAGGSICICYTKGHYRFI